MKWQLIKKGKILQYWKTHPMSYLLLLLYMSYKTARVSNVLLVMVAVHFRWMFFLKCSLVFKFVYVKQINHFFSKFFTSVIPYLSITYWLYEFFTAHAQTRDFWISLHLHYEFSQNSHPWKFHGNRSKTQRVRAVYVFCPHLGCPNFDTKFEKLTCLKIIH